MLLPAIRAIDYPCRCLWRGFEQITRTAPWRRMILHFSHMGLTEARTFMAPQSIGYSKRKAPGAQETAPRPLRPVKHSRGRPAEELAQRRLNQAARTSSARCQGVRILGPSDVIATVCSKWAAREPSCE